MEMYDEFGNPVEPIGVDEETIARELAYKRASKTISDLGYSTIQEAICDSLKLGVVNKESKTWESVSDITSVRSDRIVISKAQAKKQGLEIVVSE